MTDYSELPWIPKCYRNGVPQRYCSAENPYQGFCELNEPTGRLWKVCQRCGSHWFTVPVTPSMAWHGSWRWDRLETHLFKAAMVGVRLERKMMKDKEKVQ